MIAAPVSGIERESSLRRLAHQQFVARLQLVQPRSERALGNQFEKKLYLGFRRRRNNRIRTFNALAVLLHPQRGVLSGDEVERAARLNAKHPEVSGEVHTLGHSRLEKLVIGSRHVKKP